MIVLYKTLVRPLLEYCCLVWSPTLKGEIAQLEQVQRNFTRRIAGCREMTYWERLHHLKLQSLQRRRERYMLIQMWKIHNGLSPYVGVDFMPDSGSRQGPRAEVPSINHKAQQSKASLLEGSFSVRGPTLWNTLPASVKLSPTMSTDYTEGQARATSGSWLASLTYHPQRTIRLSTTILF